MRIKLPGRCLQVLVIAGTLLTLATRTSPADDAVTLTPY